MSIPESVSNAACVVPGDMPTARARRVIHALAKDLRDEKMEEVITETCKAVYGRDGWRSLVKLRRTRATIAAFLTHIAGE